MLELKGLVSGYSQPDTVVVDSVSLTLLPGDFICVIGRNGAGKSTLMRTICGLQSSISGASVLDGKSIPELSARERAQAISVVTTDRVSSPGLLARDVVQLGRQPYTDWRGQLTIEDLKIVDQSMKLADAVTFSPKQFDSLSDGERQRVMIARALAQKSDIMVLDEITAFLDLPGRVEIMAMLKRHAKEAGKIILLSSHDLELSLELADKIWLIHNRKLFYGDAEELIETGIIGEAFDNNGVVFDPKTRKFKTLTE